MQTMKDFIIMIQTILGKYQREDTSFITIDISGQTTFGNFLITNISQLKLGFDEISICIMTES